MHHSGAKKTLIQHSLTGPSRPALVKQSYQPFSTESTGTATAIHSLKQLIQPQKLAKYYRKSIHKHIDWVCNAVTTFCWAPEEFRHDGDKILYSMQSLEGESKNM